MASLFKRTRSPFWWLRFRDDRGKWQARSTGFRWDSTADTKRAKLECAQIDTEEITTKTRKSSADFERWAQRWLEVSWASNPSTLKIYLRYWRHWDEYFKEINVRSPAQLKREQVIEYIAWRNKQRGRRNTALSEIKLLAMVMDEAMTRGYCSANPARKLRMSRDKAKEKLEWSDTEFEAVKMFAEKEEDPLGWLTVVLFMGFYQAARISQCAPFLDDIDLERGVISYRSTKTTPFTHAIDARWRLKLEAVIKHRREIGADQLCDLPKLPSLKFHEMLLALGLKHLSHHGLRTTWITRAARAGVPESVAAKFVNHASYAVHRGYQKLSAEDIAAFMKRIQLPEEFKPLF